MPRGNSSSKPANSVPKVLHCHSSFGTEGVAGMAALQSVQLINAFGARLSHSIVSARDGVLDARAEILSSIPVHFPGDFPSLNGWPTPRRLLGLAKAMQGYDLILTYGWEAMDAAMAHTVFGQSMGLPPLIHHENGFGSEEAGKLKASRNWYRRIALGRAHGLVVPSERLEAVALQTWYQPIGRVKHISHGVKTSSFTGKCRPDALRRVVKRDGEKWVGAKVDAASDPAALKLLIASFAPLPQDWHLVILGEGADEGVAREVAAEFEVSHRVHLPGGSPDPAKVMGLFDIFAEPSAQAQMPLAVLQAMAAGLPIAGFDVGDIGASAAASNAPFIVDPAQPSLLGTALEELVGIGDERNAIGADNRKNAQAHFDEKPMIESYRRLYASAVGREI